MKNKTCIFCNKHMTPKESIIKKHVEVKGVHVEIEYTEFECSICGEYYYDRDTEIKNQNLAYDAYKKQIGLLTSDEIKKIRNKYSLSQSNFALALGMGEKTITRYENGAIQDQTNDMLIRLADNLETFKIILEKTKDKLKLNIYKTILYNISSLMNEEI